MLSIQDYVFKMVCSLLIILTTILKVFLISPIPTPLLLIAPPYQHFVKSTKYEDSHSITLLSYLYNIWCYVCKLDRKLIYGVYNLVAKEHTLTVITLQEFVVKQLSHVPSAEAKSWWPQIWRLSWDGIRAATQWLITQDTDFCQRKENSPFQDNTNASSVAATMWQSGSIWE